MQLLTQNELANHLKITVQSLISWRRRGLPYIRPPGKSRFIRYDLEAVLKWMSNNKDADNEARKLD